MTPPEAIAALIDEAWRQCYVDPLRARDIGHELVARGAKGIGWFHVGLAEVRAGDAGQALAAIAQGRLTYLALGDASGMALCDEVLGIHHRRAHDPLACRALQRDIDARPGIDYGPAQAFVAQNSRAITAKALGETDEALRQFYAALDSAERSGLQGLVVTATGNLGGYHRDLFNLDDARTLCEQALVGARALGARVTMATAHVNLIAIYHAEGRLEQAHRMAEQMVSEAPRLLPGALDRYPTQLAQAYLGVGDLETARRYLESGARSGVADGDGVVMFGWISSLLELAQGQPERGREIAERTLAGPTPGSPFETMSLHLAAARACEQLADLGAALVHTRRAHALYEEMVGRSARARYIALQVRHEVASAQAERDVAERSLQRMAELNRALQAKIDETQLLHAQLREQALRDPLTGLHNRRYLFEVGPGLIELCRRKQSTLCVVQLDLDHFKALNDDHGHQAGDHVLRRLAELLTGGLRRSDVICRHGGEEFVVLMPDIDEAGAAAFIERLLSRFHAEPLDFGRRRLPACSFSAGVAIFPGHGETLDQLLSQADRAMYRAKEGGRARVEVTQAPFSTFT